MIETMLFEKRLNLHLYIPSHFVHPPGLLPGIVYSTLFHIFTLCSCEMDKIQRTKVFFKRLIARGYIGNEIRGLFHKAITRAQSYNSPITDDDTNLNSVILHLPLHHDDLASFCIQEAWHTHVAKPKWKMPLEHMKNPKTKERCNIKRMIMVGLCVCVCVCLVCLVCVCLVCVLSVCAECVCVCVRVRVHVRVCVLSVCVRA